MFVRNNSVALRDHAFILYYGANLGRFSPLRKSRLGLNIVVLNGLLDRLRHVSDALGFVDFRDHERRL